MDENNTLADLKRRWDNAEVILRNAEVAVTNAEALVKAREQDVARAEQSADDEFDAILAKPAAPGDPDIPEPDLSKIKAAQDEHLRALTAFHAAKTWAAEAQSAAIEARLEYDEAVLIGNSSAENARQAAEAEVRVQRAERAARKAMLGPNILIAVIATVGFAIAGGGLYLFTRKPAPRDASPISYVLGTDLSSAQVVCENAIKKVARDPDRTEVPFVRGVTSDETFDFTWSRNSSLVRMTNGLGNEVGVEVACAVRKRDGKIVSLKVDGRIIPVGL